MNILHAVAPYNANCDDCYYSNCLNSVQTPSIRRLTRPDPTRPDPTRPGPKQFDTRTIAFTKFESTVTRIKEMKQPSIFEAEKLNPFPSIHNYIHFKIA